MPIYREHAPHPSLARHVECYWSIRAEIDPANPVAYRVLPDGCMDIIVSVSEGDPTPPDAPYAVGTMTRPLDVTHSGAVDLFAVRFRPGAARPFLVADAHELTDGTVTLDGLWGADALELQDRIASAPTPDRRSAALDTMLIARLGRGPEVDEPVLVAAELLGRRHGAARVDELANTAGLGRRQFERRFLASVGVSPRMACRVARLRHATKLLRGRRRASLSAIAFRAGYADQPHLTRELRALAGVTPGAYRRAHAGGDGWPEDRNAWFA